MKTVLAASAALLCVAPSFAQTDDCSAPTPINTVGTFPYDTTGNTPSGVSPCGPNFNTDAFWVWTCPAAGDYIFDTCGTGYDTRLGIYAGVDCAATCIAQNDDACGLQSRVAVNNLNTGDQLVVHVGGFGSGNIGPGVMNINLDPCSAAIDDGFEENDDCASAVPVGDGFYPGLFVSQADTDYYTVTVADGATLQVDLTFTHSLGDTDIFLYADLATCQLDEANGHGCANTLVCGFSATNNESISWTNTTGSQQTYWMKVNEWIGSDCNNYDMNVTGTTGAGGPIIVMACDPANSHSGGTYAKLDNSDGSGPGVLHLECTDGPATQFGYFLVSSILNDPGANVSNGMLCLGAPIGRYAPAAGGALNSVGVFDVLGVLQNTAGTSTVGSGYDVLATLPSPPGGAIMSGDTWYFQCWYRDGNRSNFSNVAGVTFP
jgi:hypothetical protein